MGETTDEIKQEVEQVRARLGQDLNRLEYQVNRTFDWQAQFDRNPWAFVGTAFGLAFLVGLMIGRR